MKTIEKYFAVLFFLLISFSFISCKKKNIPDYRIYLDKNWEYSLKGEPYPYQKLPDNKLNKLSDLLDSKIGYIFIRNTFEIPDSFKHKEIAINIGQIKIASKIYINNHSIGKTGLFPPHEFTEGNMSFALKIPKEYLNLGGKNTITICIWCHGYGSIGSVPFISEYNDAEKAADYSSLIYSKIYLVLSIILLFINLIYFFLYLLRRSETENLSFSQVCLFTGLYLFVFFYGEYPFLKPIDISYLLFEKIFKGATALLTGYMIVGFTRDFLHYNESKQNKLFRFILTLIAIIIPFTANNIPDFRNRLRIGFLLISLQYIYFIKIIYYSLKNKNKRLLHFLICITPFLLAFLSQLIAKIFFNQKFDTLLLAISWVVVIFLFLGFLIMHFVQLANEVENINRNLEEMVVQRTEALEKEKNRALKEIDLAGFVQKSFYKTDTSEITDWDIKITSKAMAGVSGDLYILFITENKLDGIGIFFFFFHGIASGLVTMLVKNIIEKEFRKGKNLPLDEVMTKINDRIIIEKGNIENYLTGMLIRFNKENFELVNAGHPKALLYNSETKEVSPVEQEGINQFGAIGIPDFPINFETLKFNMAKNDELVLYTDGITECTNSKKEYFGSEGIVSVFKNNVDKDLEKQVEALPEALYNFTGNRQLNDDITYIILKKLVK